MPISLSAVRRLVGGLSGLATGLAWLLPVYNLPFLGQDMPPLERMIRIVVPMVMAALPILISGRWKTRWYSSTGLFLLVGVYCGFPVLAGLLSGFRMDWVYFSLAPLLMSLALIAIGLVAELDYWESLMQGIALVAGILICKRLMLYGFEESTFFLRPRAHFGFRHPTATAAALLSVLWGWLVFVPKLFSRNRIVASAIGFTVIAFAVGKSDSRNSLLFLALWGFGAVLIWFCDGKRPTLWKFCVVAFWLANCLLLFGTILLHAPALKSLVGPIDALVSGRLASASQFIAALTGASFTLLGPGWQSFYPDGIKGFAVADSVFLSYWAHFGLLPIFALLSFWLWIGLRIGRVRTEGPLDYVAKASWFGLSSYFMFDGQGLTVSNLSLFLPLVWLFRISITRPISLPKEEVPDSQQVEDDVHFGAVAAR